MQERQPETQQYANGMPPGLTNPLGARAMYIYQDGRDTLYRLQSEAFEVAGDHRAALESHRRYHALSQRRLLQNAERQATALALTLQTDSALRQARHPGLRTLAPGGERRTAPADRPLRDLGSRPQRHGGLSRYCACGATVSRPGPVPGSCG